MLVFANISLITPRAGGIVAYASDAFGPFIGAVESAVVSSGQVENPERTVPRATVYNLLKE